MVEHSEIDFATNSKFTFFRGFWESARKMSDEDRLKFYDALGDYAFSGVEPGSESFVVDLVWPTVKPNILSSILDQARGKTGGRPPKNKDKDKAETNAKSQAETPVKTPVKTPAETNMDMDKDRNRERDRDMEEGKFVPRERTNFPSSASAATAAAKAAPPPRCPKCGGSMRYDAQGKLWRCRDGSCRATAKGPSPFCPTCFRPAWKNEQTGRFECSKCRTAFSAEEVGWR